MRFQFALREGFLVWIVVCVSLGWWVDRQQFASDRERLAEYVRAQKEQLGAWMKLAIIFAETMRSEGWAVNVIGEGGYTIDRPGRHLSREQADERNEANPLPSAPPS